MGDTSQAGVAFFYAIPVAAATWWFDWRAGAVAALACVCLYLAGTAIHPVPHFGIALAIRSGVLFAVVVGVEALRRRISVLEHSAEELEAIRQALTPPIVPALPQVDAAAAFIPSELGVSGDFYLLTNGPDGSTVAVVGDVAGHGPKAAQLATFIRAHLATFAANSSDPAEILTLANSALVERPGRRSELVSAVCLSFEPKSGTLTWAAAGHPPPLALPSLDAMSTAGETFLLGVDSDLSLSNSATVLAEGGSSGVVAYTDGATDLRTHGGGTLGLDGLRRLLSRHAHLSAEPLVAACEEKLLDHVHGKIKDDICVLVLRPRTPG